MLCFVLPHWVNRCDGQFIHMLWGGRQSCFLSLAEQFQGCQLWEATGILQLGCRSYPQHAFIPFPTFWKTFHLLFVLDFVLDFSLCQSRWKCCSAHISFPSRRLNNFKPWKSHPSCFSTRKMWIAQLHPFGSLSQQALRPIAISYWLEFMYFYVTHYSLA